MRVKTFSYIYPPRMKIHAVYRFFKSCNYLTPTKMGPENTFPSSKYLVVKFWREDLCTHKGNFELEIYCQI